MTQLSSSSSWHLSNVTWFREWQDAWDEAQFRAGITMKKYRLTYDRANDWWDIRETTNPIIIRCQCDPCTIPRANGGRCPSRDTTLDSGVISSLCTACAFCCGDDEDGL